MAPPRWMILNRFIHDLGKMLCFYDEAPVGRRRRYLPCRLRWSNKIVYPEYFTANPDLLNPALQTENGIYEPGCGLCNVHLSWVHDEYLYHVTKAYLPEPA